METIIGSITTDLGLAYLVHDDETGTYVGRYPDGHEEDLADWSPNTDQAVARAAACSWYITSAKYDPWNLVIY